MVQADKDAWKPDEAWLTLSVAVPWRRENTRCSAMLRPPLRWTWSLSATVLCCTWVLSLWAGLVCARDVECHSRPLVAAGQSGFVQSIGPWQRLSNSSLPESGVPSLHRKTDGNVSLSQQYSTYSRSRDEKLEINLRLIIDKELLMTLNFSRWIVRNRMEQIVRLTNTLFQTLHVSVVLASVEIWESDNKIDASSESCLLDLAQHQSLVLTSSEHKFANALVLMTAQELSACKGIATVGTLGTSKAVAIVQDHLDSVDASAGVLSHELGHIIGLQHDTEDGRCPCSDTHSSCIMSAVSRGIPRVWSSCSVEAMYALMPARQRTTKEDTVDLHSPATLTTLKQTAVNGTWGHWGRWSQCPRTCGVSNRYRLRHCFPPPTAPQGSLADCVGSNNEVAACSMPPCTGGGTEWSQWSACPVHCGGGTQRRSRPCPPTVAAAECLNGHLTQQRPCNMQSCQQAGQQGWSLWGVWSPCTVTCGQGQVNRQRWCNTPRQPQTCRGTDRQTRGCSKQSCGVLWTAWSQWTHCDITCGGGSRTRRRECSVTDRCLGSALEVESCNNRRCDSVAAAASMPRLWSLWSQWTGCTPQNCNQPSSFQSRSRRCRGFRTACQGPTVQRQQCRCTAIPGARPPISNVFADQSEHQRGDNTRLLRIIAIVGGSVLAVILIVVVTCGYFMCSRKSSDQAASFREPAAMPTSQPFVVPISQQHAPLHPAPAPPPMPTPYRQVHPQLSRMASQRSRAPTTDLAAGMAAPRAGGVPYAQVPLPLLNQISSMLRRLQAQQEQRPVSRARPVSRRRSTRRVIPAYDGSRTYSANSHLKHSVRHKKRSMRHSSRGPQMPNLQATKRRGSHSRSSHYHSSAGSRRHQHLRRSSRHRRRRPIAERPELVYAKPRLKPRQISFRRRAACKFGCLQPCRHSLALHDRIYENKAVYMK